MDGRTTSQRAVTTETEWDWIKLDSYDAFFVLFDLDSSSIRFRGQRDEDCDP